MAACGRLFALPLAVLALMILAAPASAYLYFGQGNGTDCPIGRANLDGTGLNHDFVIQATCGSPAVDATHIYWLYQGYPHDNIARANIDGSGANRSFIPLRGYSQGIAIDQAHIYWSDPTGIGRANLDGSGVDPTFLRTASAAGAPAVDAAHIYWIDTAGIGRANLDGTQPDPGFIAVTNAANLNGIAVDSAHIYWANSGGMGATRQPGTIGRANLDGSGVNPQFITAVSDPAAVAVDSSYVYWANYLSGTIGRASLDGSAADENFIRNTGASGLAVDALAPSPGQQAGALHGAVSLIAIGGKIHGYVESVSAAFETRDGQGVVSFGLNKQGLPITQTNGWGVSLTHDEYSVDRSKVRIEVIVPLGTYGQIDFTFTGKPHRRSLGCGETQNLARGTLQGVIRIRTGERIFKTVTIRRMSATVMDTPTGGCPPPCPQGAHYSLDASRPFRARAPGLSVYSSTPGAGASGPSGEVVGVDDPTTGTPFVLIEHTIIVTRRRPFFRADPRLAGATLTTPGGIITGALSVRASGAEVSVAGNMCKGHRYHGFGRGERVRSGQITAIFDSIGKYVFGRNLTAANMMGYRRVS